MIETLQTLRGVAENTAATLVTEVGSFSRFGSLKQLMAYAGLLPSEYSSSGRKRQGRTTKTGNGLLLSQWRRPEAMVIGRR